jgi:hypothetical protein
MYSGGDEGLRMRRFKWIEWNLQKIDGHALSADIEVKSDDDP